MTENKEYWHREDESEFDRTVEDHFLASNTSYRRVIRVVAAEARKGEPDERVSRLNEGLNIVEEIMRATNEDSWHVSEEKSTCERLSMWHHRQNFSLRGKKRLDPYLPALNVQEAAASYLQMSYRVPAIDRLLADMLIASELFAFADEVQSVLNMKRPLIFSWLTNNIVSLIIGIGLAVGIFWIGGGSTFTSWIAGIVAVITVLWTAWSLVVFPFYYPKVRAQHKKVEEIIGAMLDAYAVLGGSPASAKHLDERVSEATEKGVIWPSQLIVLIEDVRTRSSTV